MKRSTLKWLLGVAFGFAVMTACSTTPTPHTPDPGESASTPTPDLIAFTRSLGLESPQIWTMYSNGTGQKQLTNLSGGVRYAQISPDGKQIAYQVEGGSHEDGDKRIAGTKDLFVSNLDGSGATSISRICGGEGRDKSKCPIDLLHADEWYPHWSPDSKKLVFSALQIDFDKYGDADDWHDANIYTFNLETNTLTRVTPGTPKVDDSHPAWSPDGTRIAFISNRKNNSGTERAGFKRYFHTNVSGGDIHSGLRTHFDSPLEWQPSDGNDSTPDETLLYRMDDEKWATAHMNGSNHVPRPDLGKTFSASWSADGQEFVYAKSVTDFGSELFRVPIAGGAPTRLTNFEGSDFDASWQLTSPVVSIWDGAGQEGKNANRLDIKVKLSSASTESITLDYQTEADTATPSGDYLGIASEITIPAGSTTATIPVSITNDAIDEDTERMKVTVTDISSNAKLGRSRAFGEIKDNDDVPVVDVSDIEVDEDEGTADFDVTLTPASGKHVHVDYADIAGTAKRQTDYTAKSGTLTFAPGQTSKQLSVTLVDDAVEEDDEEFEVRFTVAATKARFGDGSTAQSATATVFDDDAVVVAGEEEIAFVRFPGSGGDASDVWTVPVDGGSATQFAFGHLEKGYDYEPNWGEDENSHLMYFSSYNDEDPDIYVRDMNTGTVDKVVETDAAQGHTEEYYPAISPDGTKLAFVSTFDYNGQNATGDGDLYVLDLDAPLSSTNPKQLTQNTVEDSSPAWSPDGLQIVYTNGDHGSQDLYLVPADGSTLAEQLTSETGNESYPDWSPDGESIAFSGDQDGDDNVYLLRNVGATNDIEQVTFDNGSQYDPSFSPDGQELAYGADGDIVRFDIASCIEDPLTTGTANDAAPDWKNVGGVTPDEVPVTGCVDDGGGGGGGEPINGDIVYVKRSGEFGSGDVHSMDTDGQNDANVTNTTADETDVAWNGDGTKVAFIRDDKLWMRDATTGDEEELAWFMDGQFSSPTWHATENALAFANFGDIDSASDWDIYVLDLADGSLANMMAPGDTADDLDPAWSADGTQLAYSSDRGDGTADIFTMDMSKVDVGGFFAWFGENDTRRTDLDFDAKDAAWAPEGDLIAFSASETDELGDVAEEIYFLDTFDDSVYQVTETQGADDTSDIDPAFSPDATTLLYSSDEDGDYEIYALDLSDCTTTSQLTTNTAWDIAPAVRPDAAAVPDGVALCGTLVDGTGSLDPADAEIVYSKDGAGGWDLWIMNEDGSQQSQLADIAGNEHDPVWSPDGTLVAYVGDDNAGGDPEIFVLDTTADLDGTNPVQVSTGDVRGHPIWTPDGRVAWTEWDPVDGDLDIYVANADGTGAGVLVNTDTDETYPQFFDDAGTLKVLFISSSLEGADDDGDTFTDFDSEVWLMNADGSGTPTQVTHQVNVLKEHLKVSPDGSSVAYSDDAGDVWTTDIATGNDTQQTTGGDYENQPAWSAEGTELVYVNFATGGGDIFKMPVGDDTSAEPLTSDPGQEFAPNWKPEPPPAPVDEPEVAFSSGGFDGSRNVWTMNEDGSAAKALADLPGYETQVAWSPDGSMLAFVSDADGDSEIYVHDTTLEVDPGVNPYPLTSNAVANEWPAWSPDGELILYSEGGGSSEELYYESYDDSTTATRVTNNSVRDRMGTFAPDDGDDGTPFEIAYVSEKDHAAGEIYRQTLDQDPTSATRLTTNTATDWMPAWSPLGDELAFVRFDSDSELWTMDPNVANGGTQVTNNAHSDSQPAWSPDGDALVFSSSDGGDGDLFIVDLATPAEANWEQVTDNDVADEYPTWRESWDS